MSEAGVKLFSSEGAAKMAAWREQIDEIEQWGHRLTKWELSFTESIREQLDQGRLLSDRQAETLQRIVDEKTP